MAPAPSPTNDAAVVLTATLAHRFTGGEIHAAAPRGIAGMLEAEDSAAPSPQAGPESLEDFSAIEDEAARILGRHRGPLPLTGLKELSPAAARALLHHRGLLLLGGLKSIGEETALVLARRKGDLLLGGLRTLSEELAAAFGRHQGRLEFQDLTRLSEQAALKLARHAGYLGLPRLQALSAPVARALAKVRGPLVLDGLTGLSPQVAARLAQRRGDLELTGLAKLSRVAFATLLREMKGGTLRLDGTATVPALPPQIVAGSRLAGLSLGGRLTIRDDAIEGLISLPGELRLGLAYHLDEEGAELTPSDGRAITAVGWELLGRRKGALSLDEVGVLDTPAARALSKHQGPLSLPALVHLDDDGALALAPHRGKLTFTQLDLAEHEEMGLLSAEAAAALRNKT